MSCQVEECKQPETLDLTTSLQDVFSTPLKAHKLSQKTVTALIQDKISIEQILKIITRQFRHCIKTEYENIYGTSKNYICPQSLLTDLFEFYTGNIQQVPYQKRKNKNFSRKTMNLKVSPDSFYQHQSIFIKLINSTQ